MILDSCYLFPYSNSNINYNFKECMISILQSYIFRYLDFMVLQTYNVNRISKYIFIPRITWFILYSFLIHFDFLFYCSISCSISIILIKWKQVTVFIHKQKQVYKVYLNFISMTTKNVWNANVTCLSHKGGVI